MENILLDKDLVYLMYNAVVRHRNQLSVMINHETDDVTLIRMWQGQVTKLNIIVEELKEYVK